MLFFKQHPTVKSIIYHFMKRAAFFVSLSTACVLFSCNQHKQEKEEVKDFPVTNPVTLDTIVSKDYVSQVRSVQNIEIRAQERGFLQEIFVDEGQYVKQGQLLFRIKPQLYRAELAKAQAEVKEAKIELQNAKTLADNNVVSKNEQAVAMARLEKAQAEMQLAQIHLSFTDIRAPFSGVIDRIPKRLGSLIDEGELLTSLSDNSNMYAYFNVSEQEYLNYETNAKEKGGDEVQLILANNQPLKYKGKIQTIEGEFNSETGNIAFRAKFPNPDKLLRHGETGKVRMTLPMTNAPIIPQKATYEIQDKKYVFIVDAKGQVHSRQVQISSEMPDLYVIAQGLTVQDKVLLEGTQMVREGDKIKPRYVDPKKTIAALRLKAE